MGSWQSLKKIKGFSLFELVIVMVILGIVAVSFANITGDTARGFMDARDRNENATLGKIVVEQMTREIREALPQSVRVTNSAPNYCVEFVPINGASNYLDLPVLVAGNSFSAVNFSAILTGSDYVVVAPLDAGEIYSGGGVRAGLASISAPVANEVTVTLTANHQFTRDAALNRFYVVGQPVTYCLNSNAGELRRFDSYGYQASIPTSAGAGNDLLIAENIYPNGDAFSYSNSSLIRAALLEVSFIFQNRSRYSGSEEALQLKHDIHIRNVP